MRRENGPESKTQRQTLTVEEAGVLLGVGRNSAFKAARLGQIPTIRVGRRLLVPRAAFQRLLDAAGGVSDLA
jgi:excisionase family DNA binding protein